METQIQHFHLPAHFLKHSFSFPVLETTKILQKTQPNLNHDDLFNFFDHKAFSKNENGYQVNGMLIHENVTPGFRYKVRENGTNRWFFDGRAKYLEHIGQGYGKRLTFESNDILENENFFWSDSNPIFGYSFFIQVLSPGDAFKVKNNDTEMLAIVSRVDEHQEILTNEIGDGMVRKDVKVSFEYFLKNEDDTSTKNGIHYRVEGIVSAVKRKQRKRFEIEKIEIINGAGGKLHFQPLSMN